MITAVCPKCNRPQLFPDALNGTTARCKATPGCGGSLSLGTAPAAPTRPNPAPAPADTLLPPPRSASPPPRPAAPPQPAPARTAAPAKQPPAGGWRYELNGTPHGPVSRKALTALVRSGEVGPSTPVWSAETGQWEPARDALPALFDGERPIPNTAATWWVAGGSAAAVVVLFGLFLLVKLGRGSTADPKGSEAKAAEVAAAPSVPSATPSPVVRLSAPELVARCKPSVAIVRNRVGTGSGFMLANNVVVTNYHVIEGDLVKHIEVWFPSHDTSRDSKYTAELLAEDRKRDLAILRVTAVAPSVRLAVAEVPQGEDLVVIGSPSVRDGVSANAATFGRLSNELIWLDQPYYQIDATVNGGNSGGPVFNYKGEVVAVATAKVAGKEGLNMCVPWRDVNRLVGAATDPAADAARASAEHDLSEVVAGLATMVAVYTFALELQTKSLDGGVKNGKSPAQRVLTLRTALTPLLEADRKEYFSRFEADYATAVSHRGLTEAMRVDRTPVELFDAYSRLRTLVEDFRGSTDDFERQASTQLSQFKSLLEATRVKLGVDPRRKIAETQTYRELTR